MGELIFNGESYVPVVYEKIEEPDWVKPEEWPDIKFIIENDEKVADSKVICLLDNFDDSFTFTLVNNEGLTAVKFNDGTLYEGAGTYTHTFDPANDIVAGCDRHRWYILYFNGDIANRSIVVGNLLKASLLWIIYSGKTRVSVSNLHYQSRKLQYLEEINCGDMDISALTDHSSFFKDCTNLRGVKLDPSTVFIGIDILNACPELRSFDYEIQYVMTSQTSLNILAQNYKLKRLPKLTITQTDFTPSTTNILLVYGGLNREIEEITLEGFTTSLYGIFIGSSETTQGGGYPFGIKRIIIGQGAQPKRFSMLTTNTQNSALPYLKGIYGIDFTRVNTNQEILNTGTFTTIMDITCVPNTLNWPMAFRFPNLTIESQWQMINCLKDRTSQAALTLTIPLELYQKMTAEMITAVTTKNWTISTY